MLVQCSFKICPFHVSKKNFYLFIIILNFIIIIIFFFFFFLGTIHFKLTLPWPSWGSGESLFQDVSELRGILNQQPEQPEGGRDVVILLPAKPCHTLPLSPRHAPGAGVVEVQLGLGVVAACVQLGDGVGIWAVLQHILLSNVRNTKGH